LGLLSRSAGFGHLRTDELDTPPGVQPVQPPARPSSMPPALTHEPAPLLRQKGVASP